MPPPQDSPAATTYLPEDEYYYTGVGGSGGEHSLPPDRILAAARVTLQAVGWFAFWYRAAPTWAEWGQYGERSETLPEDPAARQRAVAALAEWLLPDGKDVRDFALIMEGRVHQVIYWRHGFPGPMTLTPTELAAARSAWRREGLPDDLYYPESQRRQVIEPEERWGEVRRVMSLYSPRRWARRQATALAHLAELEQRIPSASERATAFATACDAFFPAAIRRFNDLSEPGRERQPGEAEEAEQVMRLFLALMELRRLRGQE